MKMVMSKVYKERVGCSYQMINKKHVIVKFKSVSPKRFFYWKFVYANTGFITFPPNESLQMTS